MEGMDAFKVSLEGIRENFFGLSGVMIASMIFSICAMMLCHIPLLLLMRIFIGTPFVCYRKIVRSPVKGSKQRMVFPT